jgi:hypothetical protein
MKKGFDAVAFQRKVREELGRRYWRDREAFLKELAEKNHTKNSSTRLPKVQTRKEKSLRES